MVRRRVQRRGRMTDGERLDQTAEWRALLRHRGEPLRLRELFGADPERGSRFALEAGDLYVDYSRNLVTDETVRLLRELAAARGVAERRDAMFAGQKINVTEDRAVLHVA